MATQEDIRLQEAHEDQKEWRKWGPYLSERQWGTVREDYSDSGDAWNYFSHDQARSRAYRWGEDGIAGISDDDQILCFALALWNGKDPILKERLFGLTNSEGNHGEDVKEYYFYLDSTPTHSYMKYLYKYPQAAYPYGDLVETNKLRTRDEMEYELLDTHVFDEDRYFDVLVEYAKQSPEDLSIRISATNRGPEPAVLHLLPTLWFRKNPEDEELVPVLRSVISGGRSAVEATHTELGTYFLYYEDQPQVLFTNNETNTERIFGRPNKSPHVKDAFHDYVIHGRTEAVNPEQEGTKTAVYHAQTVAPGATWSVCLRLCSEAEANAERGVLPEGIFARRKQEADEFYRAITPPKLTEDEGNVLRQALAGMLWTKQHYNFDLNRWLKEHSDGSVRHKQAPRNTDWHHMVNSNVISMPDKWEYPWYAAWDLAFHTLSLSMVDIDFAKQQLELMTDAVYLHPNGQIPAYEWNFSDVNPPVHAWAAYFVYSLERRIRGQSDVNFLKTIFNKLVLNFTWWVNRKDRDGKNVFEGGFLGLDNIGVFDRSAPLPGGGYLEQADGTAWMALFCLNMLEISGELAIHDPAFEPMVIKFAEHFLWIAAAINRPGADGLWDEEDGFYYDMLRLPDGRSTRLKVRSMVGLLPFCATAVVEKYQRDRLPHLAQHIWWRMQTMPDVFSSIHPTGPNHFGVNDRGIMALMGPRSCAAF
jgi:Mannosylglycerate hydrolase MGH1-like glycoside hydrolase domain